VVEQLPSKNEVWRPNPSTTNGEKKKKFNLSRSQWTKVTSVHKESMYLETGYKETNSGLRNKLTVSFKRL
jgi:hypothetical protein